MTGALLWVGIAAFGALGAWGRFRVGALLAARWPSDFPLGTFVVNVSGSLALGLLVGLAVAPEVLVVLGTGLLGAYTTFSTWMVESEQLGEKQAWPLVWLNLFGSMGAGLAAAGVGWLVGAGLA